MKSEWFLGALTLVNLALFVAGLSQARPAAAASETVAQVVRARTFQLVDDRGRTRASLAVYPAGASKTGERYPETVLLRLITERGRPSVKISASEEASGLSFAGPTGTDDTYLILESKGEASSLKLRNEDKRELILKP
jgi:hypothetical protein